MVGRGYFLGRLLGAALGVLVLCATAASQSSFVLPHVLERSDGGIAGIAWNLQVSPPSVTVKPDPAGGPVVTPNTDALGRSIVRLDGLFSLYGNDDFLTWLCDSINGKTASAGVYAMYSTQKGARTSLQSEWQQPSEVLFPGCDTDSKEPAGLTVRSLAAVSQTGLSDSAMQKTGSDLAKKQKLWLPSNFRLQLGDLPCTNVRKVLPIKFVVREDSDLDGGSTASSRPIAKMTVVFTRDMDPAIMKAYQSTLAGNPVEYLMRMDYLDDEGRPLLSIMCPMMIVGLGVRDPFVGLESDDLEYEVTLAPHWSYNGRPTVLKAIA